jgi:outer membrane protein TolC
MLERTTGALARDPGVIEANSPAMLVATAEYEASERALELEVRKQYPDLHLGPGVGREDGRDQVTLGLSLPLPVLNANRRGIAEARAGREVARASAEATLEQLLAGLRAAEERWRAACEHRKTLETEIVPLVDAQYADAREVARLGEVNTLVLLESLSRQQEAKMSLIGARQAESLAEIDIEEIFGPAAKAETLDQDAGRAHTKGQPEKPADAGERR